MKPLTRCLGVSMVVALALALAGRAAAEAPDPSAEDVVLRRCLVDYERTATLGSMTNGILEECLVQPGDRVKAGQVLGRLECEEIRAEIRLRELEAESDVDVRLGQARKAQADDKLKRTLALIRRNGSNAEEYQLHKMDAEAAGLAVEQAKQRRQLAQIQLKLARSRLRSREFISPHDGVVVAMPKHRGEPVAPNEPLFRVVDVDHLLITGYVDVTDVERVRIGQRVRIIPDIAGADLPIEREVFEGQVTFVDTHVDPMTGTCKILVKAENRNGLLRAGLEVRLEILASLPIAVRTEPGPMVVRTPPQPGVRQLPAVGPAERSRRATP